MTSHWGVNVNHQMLSNSVSHNGCTSVNAPWHPWWRHPVTWILCESHLHCQKMWWAVSSSSISGDELFFFLVGKSSFITIPWFVFWFKLKAPRLITCHYRVQENSGHCLSLQWSCEKFPHDALFSLMSNFAGRISSKPSFSPNPSSGWSQCFLG